jgi:hypothetical protein
MFLFLECMIGVRNMSFERAKYQSNNWIDSASPFWEVLCNLEWCLVGIFRIVVHSSLRHSNGFLRVLCEFGIVQGDKNEYHNKYKNNQLFFI